MILTLSASAWSEKQTTIKTIAFSRTHNTTTVCESQADTVWKTPVRMKSQNNRRDRTEEMFTALRHQRKTKQASSSCNKS